MHRTKLGLLAAGAALLGMLSFGAAANGSSVRSYHVALKNIAINPGVLRIHRGARVTWTWLDKPLDSSHNVTSTGKLHFRGASTRLTGMYTVRFTKPGTYFYHCTIHPLSMHAKIIVR